MAKVSVDSPRPKDPTGMNTDRYYAAKTRSVISNRFFSERKGTATKPTVPARPAMVFRSEDSNANKYYQENYGLRKPAVKPAATANKSQPVATIAAPPVAPVAPAPVVNSVPPVAPVTSVTTPKQAPKMPAGLKEDVFSLKSGDQLAPVIKAIVQKLTAGEKVRVETKSKTLLSNFDTLIEQAVNSGGVKVDTVMELLSRKLNGKPAHPLVFTVGEGFEPDMPELSVDQMHAIVSAKDPEALIANLTDAAADKTDSTNYFGDEPEAEAPVADTDTDTDDEDEDDDIDD